MPKHSDEKLAAEAVRYHSYPRPGKIETVSSKPLVTQKDLSLGYTPGVAEVCRIIEEDPEQANNLTTKSNLVGVISNGTAVLGLGNIGALAGKPVMEGKAVLFKKFSNIDVFDLEINETDPQKFVDTVASLAPTFGGINLEDIKAPECFEIEQKLKERLDIPVMHDDQHGTAIIVTAATINALTLTGKDKAKVKAVCVGAGAAGVACMKMLIDYGLSKENITMIDRKGVIYKGREMNSYLEEMAIETEARTLEEAIKGADIFFGLAGANVLTPEMVKTMAESPIIFAMANPDPEIMPDVARKARPDAIIGTGRSDFPNQINNVLGFPYLFRGALDVRASCINTEMKLAAAEALAELARKTADASLDRAYKGVKLRFGPDYLIPKPFDSRLLQTVAPAVAKAAMDSGVARKPIEDLEKYTESLIEMVDQSFRIMRQISLSAKREPGRVVYPEGEEMRILKAAQSLIAEGMAHPILIGRPDVMQNVIKEHNLTIRDGEGCTFIDPNHVPKMDEYVKTYYDMRKRDGVLPPESEIILRTRWTALGAMMIHSGDADAMVVGTTGRFDKFLRATSEIIGHREDLTSLYALQLIMRQDRLLFMADTHVNLNPTAEQIAEMARLAVDEVQHFNITPRVALLSHSNFGSNQDPQSVKMSEARRIIKQRWPDIIVEGEMQADTALDMETMHRIFPESDLHKPANILLMPDVTSANIAFNLMRTTVENMEYIGPILLGLNHPVHILNVNAPVRRIIQMSALAVVEAQTRRAERS